MSDMDVIVRRETLTGPFDLEISDVALGMGFVNHIYYEGNLPVCVMQFGIAAAPVIISECMVNHYHYNPTPTLRYLGYRQRGHRLSRRTQQLRGRTKL
jgi:hypothetical protein